MHFKGREIVLVLKMIRLSLILVLSLINNFRLETYNSSYEFYQKNFRFENGAYGANGSCTQKFLNCEI